MAEIRLQGVRDGDDGVGDYKLEEPAKGAADG